MLRPRHWKLRTKRFSDAALRNQLVAAYVIGWSVTEDDMAHYPALSRIGICSSKAQSKCIVTYNTQQNPGDFSRTIPFPTGIVQANAYSVNPLTWVASNPNEMEPAAATANLGALFYKFQPPKNLNWGLPQAARLKARLHPIGKNISLAAPRSTPKWSSATPARKTITAL